jgi:hypothetical protein
MVVIAKADFETGIGKAWHPVKDVVVVGGRLRVDCLASYDGYTDTDPLYPLRNATHTIEVPTMVDFGKADGGIGTTEVFWAVSIDDNNGLFFYRHDGSTFAMRERAAGKNSDVDIVYDPVAHRWWRIHLIDDVIYWQTSPDGEVWTTRRTKAAAVNVDKLTYNQINSGFWGAEAGLAPAYTEFDNWSVDDGTVPPPERPLGALSLAIPSPYRSRATWPPAGWRPCRDDDFWNIALPLNPKKHPRSDQIVANHIEAVNHQFITAKQPAQDGPNTIVTGVGIENFEVPVYWANTSDPVYTVHSDGVFGPWPHEGDEIYVPAEAIPADGSDHHMELIQPDGGVFGMWNVTDKDDVAKTILCSWGGNNLPSGGIYGDGQLANTFGACALNNLASVGSVRACDLEAGEIPHAIAMVVNCVSKYHLYPGRGQPALGRPCDDPSWDGDDSIIDKPVLGMRFFLEYSDAEIAALDVPEWKKTWVTALARRGAVINDTGGHHLRYENDAAYRAFGYAGPLESYFRNYAATIDDTDIVDFGNWISADLNRGVDWTRWAVAASPALSRRGSGSGNRLKPVFGQVLTEGGLVPA